MGKWKKVKLGDCIKEVVEKTTKNNQYQVLSVTKDGIFSQKEFFKKQIASKNNIGYKIIRKNNLVFSTMNLWMGSLDVLLNYDIGIVSPAYKVFKFNEKIMLSSYGNYFMKSYYMLEQYKICSEQGASVVRRNLDLNTLLKIQISLPSIKEQQKIVKVLNETNEIIEKKKIYIELVKKQKKFLMNSFQEKSNKWKERKFAEVFDVFSNNNLSREKLNYKEGKYKNIHYGDILIKYNEIVNIKEDINVPYINKSENDKVKNYIQLRDGDIIIADTAEDETVGKAIEVSNCDSEKVLSGLHTIACRPKINFIKGYLGYYINSDNFHNQLIPLMQGIKVMGITKRNILNRTYVRYPHLNIQRKIVNIMNMYSKKEYLLKKQVKIYEQLYYGLSQKLLAGKIKVKI